MQSDGWAGLLQKVPPAYQNTLMIVTAVGLEISVQAILRMEEQYLAIRGRLAGTTDTGRIFFIPYDRITFVCVQKPMQEVEINAMFGEPAETTAADEAAPPELPALAEVEDVEKTQPLPLLPVREELAKPVMPPRLSKSELLARIRSRSQGAGVITPPPEQ